MFGTTKTEKSDSGPDFGRFPDMDGSTNPGNHCSIQICTFSPGAWSKRSIRMQSWENMSPSWREIASHLNYIWYHFHRVLCIAYTILVNTPLDTWGRLLADNPWNSVRHPIVGGLEPYLFFQIFSLSHFSRYPTFGYPTKSGITALSHQICYPTFWFWQNFLFNGSTIVENEFSRSARRRRRKFWHFWARFNPILSVS